MSLFKKKFSFIQSKFKRFIKFGFVGGIGVLVNLVVFSTCAYIFKHILEEQVINLVFPAVAYEIAVVNNFLFSYFWVWKDRKRAIIPTFFKYNLSTLFAFMINYAFFNGSLYVFNIQAKVKIAANTQFLAYIAIYGLALGIGMMINFMLIEFKVFKKIDE